MVHITIRDLHMKTGDWVRKAAGAGNIVVTDRRRPVAVLVPFAPGHGGTSFAKRPLVKGFEALPKMSHDSTCYLEEDRQ